VFLAAGHACNGESISGQQPAAILDPMNPSQKAKNGGSQHKNKSETRRLIGVKISGEILAE